MIDMVVGESRGNESPVGAQGRTSGLISPLHMAEGDMMVGDKEEEVDTVSDGEGQLSEESLVAGGMSTMRGKSEQALSLSR